MGYSLIKYLDSAEYHRALFYLDRGESDLPPIDKNIIAAGSKAISQSTGQEWFLDSNLEWKPVRDIAGSKGMERNKYGGNEFEVMPSVNRVEIRPSELTMNRNAEAQLVAEIYGDDIFDRRIRWDIVSSKTADTYISQDGLLHIGDYKKPAVITVQATSLLDSKKSARMNIQVDPYAPLFGAVYGIEISPRWPVLNRGDSI